jgi:hypothetical protein
VILTAAAAQAQANNTAGTSSTKPGAAQTTTAPLSSSQIQKTKTTTSAHRTSSKSKRSRKASARKRGQQKIDADRTREIQEALIREHYFTGNATGTWDDATQKAMQHYQGANGWQSKTTPDARALIKLGLGPDHQHLLNPDSAMTTGSQVAATHAANAPGRATPPPAPVGDPKPATIPGAYPAGGKTQK